LALNFAERLTKPSDVLAITRIPIQSDIGGIAALFFGDFLTSCGTDSKVTLQSFWPAFTEGAIPGRSVPVSEKASNPSLHRTPAAAPPSPVSSEPFGDSPEGSAA
jgi:hypothetical protein